MEATTTVGSGALGDVTWKVAERSVSPDLAPYVLGMYGYRERSPGMLRRRELPGPHVVVILQLGPPIRVYDSGQTLRASRSPAGFVAGIDDRFTLTEFGGEQRGLELKLSPLGARLLFGLPMHEVAGRMVDVQDVTPALGGLLPRVADAPTWDARFELVEALIRQRLCEVTPRARLAHWAFERMRAQGGNLKIETLARELGYSQKHVIALFRDQIGLSPKRAARLLRFDRLATELRAHPTPWARLASDLGFADQAHLAREVRHFAGLTPGELLGYLGQPVVLDPKPLEGYR